MTTQASPIDNERLARLEGGFEQLAVRLGSIERRLDNLERSVDSLRTLMFTGFGLMWATMVGGFTAVFVAVLSIDP